MPEQLTEEDLKNMSPEQIEELRKQNCPFCMIAKGQIPSKKIYEDDKCLAVLDINPASPGHVILFPKEHFFLMPQMPEDLVAHLAAIAKQLSLAILRGLKDKNVEGANIFIANGAVAGQKAPHFIVHIIPRRGDDDLSSFMLPKKSISLNDIVSLQKILGGSERMDKKEESKEEEKAEDEGAEEPKEEKPKAKPAKKKDKVDLDTISNLLNKPSEDKEKEDDEDDDQNEEESELDLDSIAKVIGK